MGGLVGAAGLRIDLDKVEGARTGLTGLVEHHGNLERGGAAGIKGALGVGGGIQYIRADGDVDHVGVLADDVDGLLNGGLPAVELDLPGCDHSGAGLLGLDALLMVVAGAADADVDDLGGVKVLIPIQAVEGRAAGVQVITGVLSLVGVVITNTAAARRTENKITTAQAVTDTKLDELTREVREHNGFARRMPVVEEQIKVANHRISDLEKWMEGK